MSDYSVQNDINRLFYDKSFTTEYQIYIFGKFIYNYQYIVVFYFCTNIF